VHRLAVISVSGSRLVDDLTSHVANFDCTFLALLSVLTSARI
jgi:hypothetical protein